MSAVLRRACDMALLIALFVVTTALSCSGGGGGGPDTIFRNKCPIVLHDYWPSGKLEVTKPAECPIKIPAANYPVDFAEGGTFGPGTVGTVRLTVYDANNQLVAASNSFNVQVNTIGGTLTPHRDTLSISGTYPAGVAGFTGSMTDQGVNDIELSGVRRLATAMLTYQQRAAVSIAGPTEALPYENITLDADLHVANAVPPLSWLWYHNGSSIGSQESVSWSGPMTAAEDFSVTVRDGYGAEWSRLHRVYRAIISGPKKIQPGATCTWQAIPFDGVSPYSYRWENHGLYAGNQEYYTGSKDPGLGSFFNLRLVITDATGFVREQTITVQEDSAAPTCII